MFCQVLQRDISMGDALKTIDVMLADFIRRQPIFFVATAPLSADGFVNLSPKGLDSFRILSPTQVVYADYTGSGIETVAHLKENGRIVIMFCAFEGTPGIIRLHGTGRVIEAADPEFAGWIAHFESGEGVRAVIVVDCIRISKTCGFGVPLFRFEGHRRQLTDWCERKGSDGLADYHREKNATSLDGLPGISVQ